MVTTVLQNYRFYGEHQGNHWGTLGEPLATMRYHWKMIREQLGDDEGTIGELLENHWGEFDQMSPEDRKKKKKKKEKHV